MSEFYGKDLVFEWIGSGGSIDLSEYQRGVTFNPGGEIVTYTTQGKEYETRLPGRYDFTASYKGLMQSMGTAAEALLMYGEIGTIYLYPEGKATGKREYILPCISQGPQVNVQYDNLTELMINFVGANEAYYRACSTPSMWLLENADYYLVENGDKLILG
jgi:hypothetical protein